MTARQPIPGPAVTAVRPLRPTRGAEPGEDPAVAEADALIEALSSRGPLSPGASRDPAVRLLSALIDDVDQRRSSVSVTPSA
ncbi:hypothetical protein GCM10017673_47990 [Streptosporangium violaceochromogenes]|nr:hypothetical protein GCM10017673_47990 [Streptosporangium violaceochromogenes]